MTRFRIAAIVLALLALGGTVVAPKLSGSAQDATPTAVIECPPAYENDPADPSGNAANIESLAALWQAVLPYEQGDLGAVFPPDTILNQPLETTMAATIELAAREPGVGAVVQENYGAMIRAYLAANPDAIIDTLSGRATFWLVETGMMPNPDGCEEPVDASPTADATSTPIATTEPDATPTETGGFEMGTWYASFYATHDQSGEPVLTSQTTASALDNNWATGAPGEGVPEDGFSVHYYFPTMFDPGVYRMVTSGTMRIELYRDGALIHVHRALTGSSVINLAFEGGSVDIEVRAYSRGGDDRMKVSWEQTAPLTDVTPAPTATATPEPTAPPEATATP